MPLSALPCALLLLLCALFASAQSDPPATPSNSSTFTPAVLADPRHAILGSPGIGTSDLQTLTQAADNALNHSMTANFNNNAIGNGLASVTGDTSNLTAHSRDSPIAYVSCEPSAYSGFLTMSRTIQNCIDSNASAIVLYSTSANFCNLSTNLSDPFNSYGRFYSMTNLSDARIIVNGLNRATPNPGYLGAFRIATLQAYSNTQMANPTPATGNPLTDNAGPGTNVAMIILYSITGVIALLFVIIIVTGAVRAHRHPERYGPRNVAGRPRQNRAMGIGRAMLETLPLVKFGETPPPKSTDVEMNDVSRTDSTRAVEGAAADGTAPADSRQRTSTSADGVTVTKADASGKDAPGLDHQAKVEKSLECAICWDDFEKGEEVRMLPCEHKFHPKCIDPWLLGFSGTCPVCRVDFGGGSKKQEEEEEQQRQRQAEGASGSGSGSSEQPNLQEQHLRQNRSSR